MSAAPSRSVSFVIGSLILFFGCIVFWPPFRLSSSVGLNAITRPFLKYFFPIETSQVNPQVLAKSELAKKARSMEFRLQQYSVTPDLLNSWCAEWKCTPTDKKILLSLMLRQLPEAVSGETPSAERIDLVQCIATLVTEGMKTEQDNAFYHLANGLLLFYTNQDEASLIALKESQSHARLDPGFKEINESEYILWRSETKADLLFPPMPRVWGLRLERPLHTWSRGLGLQERSQLQKYNLEKAVEIGLLHLGLAEQLSRMGLTSSDLFLSQAIKNRALEPFWSQKDVTPNSKQLEDNFVSFLEDQGDKISSAKAREWISAINKRQSDKINQLPRWRLIQSFSNWNISSILGSIFLQTASLLIVWATLLFYARVKHFSSSPSFLSKLGFANIAFAIAPIAWMISGWPAGGNYMFLGAVLAWFVWFLLIYFSHSKLNSETLTFSISQGLVAMLTSTVLLTAIAAFAFQYRQSISKGFLD
jgi:hypothetical protein